MVKQITMVITLGLILTVGALTTIYPQHASAVFAGGGSAGNGGMGGVNTGLALAVGGSGGGSTSGGGNGINGGQTPPGWDVASGTPAVKHNPNLQGSTPSGGLGTNSGGQGYCHGGICTRG